MCEAVENLSRIVSKFTPIRRLIGERQKKIVIVCMPNLCVYNVLLLTDRKQCFSLSVLSRRESYRQPVARTPCVLPDHRITDHRLWNSDTPAE